MGLLGADQHTTSLPMSLRQPRPAGAPASVRQAVTDPERERWLAWVEHRLGIRPEGRFDRERAVPLAVLRGGALAAVAVYSHWRAGSVEMTIAADTPRWATRETVSYLLDWPFVVLRVRRVTALVASRNERSRKLVEGVGFELEGLMKAGFPDDDALIFGLTRPRWIEVWGNANG